MCRKFITSLRCLSQRIKSEPVYFALRHSSAASSSLRIRQYALFVFLAAKHRLEICMHKKGIGFTRELFTDNGGDRELTKVAEYSVKEK